MAPVVWTLGLFVTVITWWHAAILSVASAVESSDKNVVLNLFVVVVVLHASLRLRNVKNKIASKVEYIGISRTPMGLLLEALGMEQEAAS